MSSLELGTNFANEGQPSENMTEEEDTAPISVPDSPSAIQSPTLHPGFENFVLSLGVSHEIMQKSYNHVTPREQKRYAYTAPVSGFSRQEDVGIFNADLSKRHLTVGCAL